MKKYSAIIFDLDGTLLDTGAGIKKAVKSALMDLGQDIPSEKKLNELIGPPLGEGLRQVLGIDDEHIDAIVNAFRQHYENGMMYEASLYPEMEKLLNTVKEAGIALGVATAKPEKFAKPILERFSMNKYFYAIVGSSIDGPKKSKADLISDCLTMMDIEAANDVLYVGDRGSDMIASNELGISSVGALWGYGSEAELYSGGASTIVTSVVELAELL